jgi:chromosome segregation ATPase
MEDAPFELSAARARLEAEIEALQVKQRHLDVVRGEFEHDGRRVRDALERVGGRSHELEQRMKSLARNEKLTDTDLEQNAKALKRLERRLAEITAEIARAEGS